jgi:hypothetical protein
VDAEQAELPAGGEPRPRGHVLVHGEPVGVQRESVGVGQARPTEVELAADMGAEQADLADGGEPMVEFEIAAGGELVSGQAGQVAAGHHRRLCLV